ncbi:ABC transporter substrate-binding protein, partial [uncultured Oscillibacter sp.]
TPEINAISTLLFVTVLALLVVVNLREAQLERTGRQETRRPRSQRLILFFDSPRGKLFRRGTAGALAAAFLVVVVFLTSATNAQPTVNVCSWGEYIDEDLITQFEEETGIMVNYQTADSNETLYSLLKNGGADYDVIVPSDYMISQLIEEDMLEELDYSQIPNYALISDRFKGLTYDPEERYTVPYAWGTVGIIYNTTMVEEPITSWSAMFDGQYAGNVLMFRNSRDAMATALLYLGYSVNTTDEAELREAFQLLKDAKNRGVYQSFVMDEIFQKLEGGNAAVGAYYAGDYLTMLENNEDLAFVVPEEGSNWFMDAMCVLKGAPHFDEAMAWINFIASTEANLKNMDYLWYASPNQEALEQYPAYYEELYEEELDQETYGIIAASQEVLDRCEAYLVLPANIRTLYNDLWTELGI